MSSKRTYVDTKGTKHVRARQVSIKCKHRPLNRHVMEGENESTSRSVKKLKESNNVDITVDAAFGYRIINFISVFSAISQVVKCKKCNGDIEFTEASCRGLGFKLLINCSSCEPTSVNSSPLINGMAYEINRRITFIFRLLGLDYTALEKFCGLMDLPKTFTESLYSKISTNIFEAAEAVCEHSMKEAVKEEISLNEGSTDLTVSGDWTWHKRAFSSLFGMSSLIGYKSGKVLDITTKSSHCKECESRSNQSGTPEYETWKKSHEEHCNINHDGLAGKMEVDAMKEMFQRSEEKHSVRYVNYVADSDSKTYEAVVKSKPYKDVNVTRKEGIGQKQNYNESLNSVIWTIAPKSKFCDKHTVDFASYSAASLFNDGHVSVLLMMQLMGLTIGPQSHSLHLTLDERRISQAEVRQRQNSSANTIG